MDQSSSLVKKFPTFLWNPKVHHRITSARHLSLPRDFLCDYFVTRYVFTVRSCQHLAQPPNLEDHPLSAVRDCLLNIFAATLHIGGRSSIRNARTRHAVVTGN